MKAEAQVVDFKQYKNKKAGGRPCGGKLYSTFHDNSSNNNVNSARVFVPPGYKLCKKRGLVKIKEKPIEQKKEKHENNIDNLASEKKEIKEEDIEVKKEDRLSKIVKDNYVMNQREKMEEINQYKRVQNYEELNKKVIPIKEQGICPLCGSKTNQNSEEEVYSKAA